MDHTYKRTLFSLLNCRGARDWWDVNKYEDIEVDLNFDMNQQHSPVLREEPIVPPETSKPVDSTDVPDVETTQRNSKIKKNHRNSKFRKVPDKNLDDFEITVDVEGFEYNEIEVHIDDTFFVIHAKQKDRPQNSGFVSKEITRKFKIPEDVEVDKVKSFGFEPGVVKIVCPRKKS